MNIKRELIFTVTDIELKPCTGLVCHQFKIDELIPLMCYEFEEGKYKVQYIE
jgi:hypothetical protein